jgi:uncharacterized protein (TIGR00369 family)
MTHPELPAGFAPLPQSSPVLDLIGPLYLRRDGGTTLALQAQDKHCNSRGVVHGGILATLADTALGYALLLDDPGSAGVATVNLSLDYAAAAQRGDWLQAEVQVQRRGRRLAFANCYLTVEGRPVVRASGVFQMIPAA